MKNTVYLFLLISCLTLLSSFSGKPPITVPKGKYGVYLTYQDFINHKLTDKGQFAKCSRFNKTYDYEIEFENELIKASDTKYWGVKLPHMEQAKGHFNICYQPDPSKGHDEIWHYANGEMYHLVINPGPIGVYRKFTQFTIKYNKDSSDILGYSIYEYTVGNTVIPYCWADKEGKGIVHIENRATARDFFSDDAELLAEYDKLQPNSPDMKTQLEKDVFAFLKIAVKYNARHRQKKG